LNPFSRVVQRYERTLAWAREHSPAFDHFWRAKQRYDEVYGGRLAAATAYYGFFAAFALGLVAYSVLGYLVASDSELQRSVDTFLEQNLPFFNVESLASDRRPVGIIGLVGLVFTGVGWVESMRTSQRAIWDLDQQPGNLAVRRLVDLGMLVGLGVLLGLSLTAADSAEGLLWWAAPDYVSPLWQDALRLVGPVVGFGVNLILAAAALAALPRLRIPFRRILPPMLVLGLGTTLLTTIGRYYIARIESNPAYTLVAGTAGALLFLFLFGQLVLFSAALAATSSYGQVRDLAAGPPADAGPDTEPDKPDTDGE
jgi:membrane protein